ncbi:tetratricopeptide repeat protein [Bacteroidota bacterium]
MKNLLLLILFVFSLGIFTGSAQTQNMYENPAYGPDSASRMECGNNLSTMSEFMKIDLYSYALPSWRKVLSNCPGSSKNIYLYGVEIYRNKLDNSEDPDLMASALDTLMLIYDMRIEHFGQEGLVLGRKALDLFKYDRKQNETTYQLLQRSVEISKENTEPSVMVTMMQISNAMFKAGKIEGRELVDNYLGTIEILEARGKSSQSKTQTVRALGSIEAIFAQSGAADCETLIEIFGPKFEQTPEDLEFLKKVTTLLIDQKCEDSELFANASENLYKLEPSAQAAYNLAILFYKKEDFEKSVSYYREAIDRETDLVKKAKYQYELGLITYTKYDDFVQARALAREAISNNPQWGQPYILIGNLYAGSSSRCGENEFEKTTVFWAAVDKFYQAKAVDASIDGEATEQINKYSQYFPNVEDAFFYGFEEGQPFTVGCWINEKTTVRSRQRP